MLFVIDSTLGLQVISREIARKDTTIFSNRGHFIVKLTPQRQKIIVLRR